MKYQFISVGDNILINLAQVAKIEVAGALSQMVRVRYCDGSETILEEIGGVKGASALMHLIRQHVKPLQFMGKE